VTHLFLKGIDFNGRKHIKRSILIQVLLNKKMLIGQNYCVMAGRITGDGPNVRARKKIGRKFRPTIIEKIFENIIWRRLPE